ncbi:phenoloxidase-activating factor 2-like [Contarinia nasturtii]|uniref:phenoloxidase-activating factor 2-like n=1 Tax=Contarinia nasturtii TaxID=265458 RepID=UPI0012D4A189|nr:phenoloxidase-activating factor 2-like [Contarinia nasturtii]
MANALPESPLHERNVTDIIIHDNYLAGRLKNDIALIVVDKSLKLTNAVNTICLPPPSVRTNGGTICTSGGWGKSAINQNGKYQATPKKIKLPIVNHRICEAILSPGFKHNLPDSFICAGGGTLDTYKGDGGSPLFCRIPNDIGRFYQTGIASGVMTRYEQKIIASGMTLYGIPGLYVNVAYFSDWITQQLQFINGRMRPENILSEDLFFEKRNFEK